jgi:hypothetical protein
MVKNKILIYFLFLSYSSFSQSFRYYFENLKINEFLEQNPIEHAFNEVECFFVDENDTDGYNCDNNFGKLKTVTVNDSTEVLQYQNGNLATEIIDLKPIRKVKNFYFGTSLVFSECEYKNNKLNNITFYTKNGKKLDIGNLKNGSGKLKYYRQNETVSAILDLKNGILDGKVILYYSNGKKMLEGSFKEGTEVGDWKEFIPIK